MAFAIDHPLYDCLYLACAETTGSVLVTADKRLANKPVAQILGVRVEYLGDADVARRLEVAAFAPVIKRQQVDELTQAFDLFAKTERNVLDKLFAGTEGLRITTDKDREFFLNSPSYKRLINLIKELDDKERVDLLALGWFGAGRFPNWRRSVEHAETAESLALHR